MKYVNSLNHYRAIAIVFIVAVHTQFVADFKLNTYASKFFQNIISGSTLNFVFISGFLFYVVFYKRFKYSVYVKSRINRFVKPYLFLSVLPIIVGIVAIPLYWDNSNIVAVNAYNSLPWHFVSTVKYLVSGAHITAYWYIPFVLVLALTSPLHFAFIKLDLKKQLTVIFLLFVLALFVQRPYEREFVFQAIQSLIYCIPMYLMGVICAIYSEYIYKFLKGKEVYLLIFIITIVTIQTNLDHVGLYKTDFLVFNGIDFVLIKMIFVCLFFMIWLHRFEHIQSRIINSLANTSFAIYFLHVYILQALLVLKKIFNLNFENYSIIAYIFLVCFIVGTSMLLAFAVKRLFPKYAYTLVGYGKRPMGNS